MIYAIFMQSKKHLITILIAQIPVLGEVKVNLNSNHQKLQILFLLKITNLSKKKLKLFLMKVLTAILIILEILLQIRIEILISVISVTLIITLPKSTVYFLTQQIQIKILLII